MVLIPLNCLVYPQYQTSTFQELGGIYMIRVRIPVSSPYIEVRMDTSGTYALVKACTDTSRIYGPTLHTGHTHTLHVTYTIDKHSLCARFTRTVYTVCIRFTSTLYARTFYASNLHVQYMRLTYTNNLRARLMRTIYAPNLHDTSRDTS